MNLFKQNCLHKLISTITIFISLSSISVSEITAQTDSSDFKKINWHIYPVFFYTPETDFAFGGLSILLFRLSEEINSKPSNIRFVGYYTLNSQFSLSIKPEIYLKRDKFLLESEIYFSKITDKFFGIGNDTEDSGNPEYDYRKVSVLLQLQYEIIKNLRAGLIYEFRTTTIKDLKQNLHLLSGEVAGTKGGVNSGTGFLFRYDSRDNLFYPSVGGLYKFALIFFDSFTGSDFNYTKAFIDLRRFFTISDNQVFAGQLYYNFISGTPPFYEFPALGGEELMRGYYTGRYRDKHYFAAQLEYRLRLWWKFGIVGFAGMGDVARDILKFEMKKFKYSYGGGIRFRIDDIELIDLRLDIGFGKNTTEFYLGYNQAF